MIKHLYVHIPFCPKVCPYCSFYKEASDRNKTQAFLDAVLAEAARWSGKIQPETVFFGGGTPTALSTTQLDYLISGLKERLDFSAVEEWTLEMNPATVSLEKARRLGQLGVNRVSMGVQSWDPDLLRTLGRVHTGAQAERSFELLREAGFTNINLDLMFGIPGQTLKMWEESITRTLALRPEHIAAYCLTYEEDTAFFTSLQKGEFVQDEEIDASFFETVMARLEAAGYVQYEISNYATPGNDCRHNLAYWLGKDYLGLGPSAFSTIGEQRWRNVADTQSYINGLRDGRTVVDFEEAVPSALRLSEASAFGLRTNRGIIPTAKAMTQLQPFLDAGHLTIQNRRWILTRSGRLLADAIAEAVL